MTINDLIEFCGCVVSAATIVLVLVGISYTIANFITRD